MNDSLEQQVKNIVIELFLAGDSAFPMQDDTDLIMEGICDSLGLVRLAATLEERFPGVRIQDQDVTHENLGSPRAIVEQLKRAGVSG